MAKKGSSPSWWLDHLLRLDQYSGRVSRIYQKYVDEFTRLATSVKVDPDRPFSFDDYPTTKGAIQKAMEKIVNEVTIEIDRATRAEWLESAFKNDKLVDQILLTSGLSRAQIENFYNHNLEALSSFQRRKDGSGLDLSDRVWRNTQQYKQEIELGIDAALGEGKSAAKLSQDVRGFLNEPEKLFRRIRDKRGNLHLSKNARAYHPGRGVYRSSYRNAMRLAVSETNMAYKVSDQTRWEQLPIVVGYEIKISNNHPVRDICDDLKGKYPKTFKFKGWHPFCRCYVVSILISDEERDRLQQMILNGDDISGFSSALNVSDVPDGFKKWCVDNAERVKNWKSTPYWIRDNFKQGNLSKGLVQIKPTVPPPAPKPKPTPEPKKDIPPIQPTIEEVNNTLIEKKIGVKQGNIMTFEEANELKGNINYGKDRGYGINCQSCVVANELRRRGFNVTALPNTRGDCIPSKLSYRTEWAWIDPVTGLTPKKTKCGGIKTVDSWGRIKSKTIKELSAELSEAIKEVGRYHIDFAWKGGRSGHIITLEKLESGKVRLYDPQPGRLVLWQDLKKQVSLRHGVNVLRVDNLLVNTDIIDGVVRKL